MLEHIFSKTKIRSIFTSDRSSIKNAYRQCVSGNEGGDNLSKYIYYCISFVFTKYITVQRILRNELDILLCVGTPKSG